MFYGVLKLNHGATWVAQSIKYLPLAQVKISGSGDGTPSAVQEVPFSPQKGTILNSPLVIC